MLGEGVDGLKADNILQMETLLVLGRIGFKPSGFGYSFDFVGLKLNAVIGFNLSINYGVHFAGVFRNARSFSEIQFSIPEEVDSYEQGLGYLAYFLQKYPIESPPQWLTDGQQYIYDLPFLVERRKQLWEAEYANKATVDHQLFKLHLKKIRSLLDTFGDQGQELRISFKEKIFKIEIGSEVFVFNGSGSDWTQEYILDSAVFKKIPPRLPRRDLTIGVQNDGQIRIGRSIIGRIRK